MPTDSSILSPLYRSWNIGQQHLAAGRYLSARSALQTSEKIAWQSRDFRSLARIHLPLLEAQRQIRQNAADGQILFLPAQITSRPDRENLNHFLQQPAGTLLILCRDHDDVSEARRITKKIYFASRKKGNWLETLLILRHKNKTRLVSAPAPLFSNGLPIIWTHDPKSSIAPSTETALPIPLPPPGIYEKDPLHILARESLLIAWENLALHWQHRHPPAQHPTLLNELTWLRRTLQIDPACEPVTMRLIALAEAADRASATQ